MLRAETYQIEFKYECRYCNNSNYIGIRSYKNPAERIRNCSHCKHPNKIIIIFDSEACKRAKKYCNPKYCENCQANLIFVSTSQNIASKIKYCPNCNTQFLPIDDVGLIESMKKGKTDDAVIEAISKLQHTDDAIIKAIKNLQHTVDEIFLHSWMWIYIHFNKDFDKFTHWLNKLGISESLKMRIYGEAMNWGKK